MNGQRRRSVWLWSLGLFLLALAPRLPGLGQFLTSDEQTNIFAAGSDVITALLRGDLAGTYWHFYPGVTMTWTDAIGLGLGWLLARLGGDSSLAFSQYLYGNLVDLLVAARLPYAVLSALFSPALFVLLRRLFDDGLALAAALLVALDPFFLAHSRLAHGDMPVSVFMALSALAFFLHMRQNERKWLVFSGLMGGLAALTKAPGQFIAPFVIVVALGHWLAASFQARQLDRTLAWRWLVDLLIWGGVALLLFVALWPAMWVDPAGTVGRLLAETLGKVEEGHLVYFRGRPTLDPGLGFYLTVIPFRLTPLTSLGALLSLGLLGYGLLRRATLPDPDRRFQAGLFLVWVFVVLILLGGNLSPKKQDRYLLPLFPMLDVLAALGWLGLWRLLESRRRRGVVPVASSGTSRPALAVVLALVAAQAALSLPHHPYYLAYFNPLLGGLPRAVTTTLVGWGEGMEQAAAYLNQKPNAESLYVASTPSQTFLPYFAGRGENFYTNDVALRADYVVIYLAQKQRRAPSPEIVSYFEGQTPEYVVEIEDVPYVWVYANQPLITPEAPPDGSPANIGFGQVMRLAGYKLAAGGEEDTLQATLFWHALPPIAGDTGPCREQVVERVAHLVCDRKNYTVSARVVDAEGRMVGQHDSPPANGLLPTGQWRPGDYVRDAHAIPLPPELPAGRYRLETVVYQAETGQVLAGPVVVTAFEFPADLEAGP
ncbi:MAG: ArnT family glycosyltransferase [Anaerolineae bacterium]